MNDPMFINRRLELLALREGLSGRAARLFVVYGRRRVGKTALLVEFARHRDALVYTAEQSTETVILEQISEVAARAAHLPHLALAPFRSWEALFLFLAEWAAKRSRLVVLDEFPYMLQAAPALASKLQKAWDATLGKTALHLVLCGSYVSVMEQEVLGVRSPLYGRRTGQMRVKPMDFFDARGFLASLPLDRQLEAYAVMGGVPAYLGQYDHALDLYQNLEKNVLRPEAFLHEEPRFLLLQELREPRNYFAILRALSLGNTRLNDIVQQSRLERTVVSRYLDILRSMGLVRRDVPATESAPEKSRRGLYRVADNFLRFWFRYVFPNTSDLEAGRTRLVLDEKVRPEFASFVGPIFEDVVLQWLRRVEGTRTWPERYRSLGRWWDRNAEIDVVGLEESGRVLCAECKWSERPVGTDVLENLVKKGAALPVSAPPETMNFAIFSRSGFTDALRRRRSDRVRLVDFGTMV